VAGAGGAAVTTGAGAADGAGTPTGAGTVGDAGASPTTTGTSVGPSGRAAAPIAAASANMPDALAPATTMRDSIAA
jgi:hypothetical protein